MARFITLHRDFPKDEEVYVNIETITHIGIARGTHNNTNTVFLTAGSVDVAETPKEVMALINNRIR